jgi:CubicO group peptidase (beta-lactamase class C family)
MNIFTRRKFLAEWFLRAGIGTAGLHGYWGSSLYNEEITPGERSQIAKIAREFMRDFDVPALSVTIAPGGDIAYEQAFGVADAETAETSQKISCSHRFRIASVSKTITSVAIYTLIEAGRLKLGDKVFGENGILRPDYPPPYKDWVDEISVEHLLTHTCGGWPKGPGDPMFGFNDLDHRQLIFRTVTQTALISRPGTRYFYSNFGYCVLGRVIEKLAGMTYTDYVCQKVLSPCSVASMAISGNTPGERAPNEVAYYGQNGENPYSVNVRRMDSNGGWIGTATDLVRFLTHLDLVLKPASITNMTTASSANRSYAKGWSLRNPGIWCHNGSLPGTTTEIVRTSTGFCWATLTNTRRQPSSTIDEELYTVGLNMARSVSAWRNRLP